MIGHFNLAISGMWVMTGLAALMTASPMANAAQTGNCHSIGYNDGYRAERTDPGTEPRADRASDAPKGLDLLNGPAPGLAIGKLADSSDRVACLGVDFGLRALYESGFRDGREAAKKERELRKAGNAAVIDDAESRSARRNFKPVDHPAYGRSPKLGRAPAHGKHPSASSARTGGPIIHPGQGGGGDGEVRGGQGRE